MQAVLCNTAQQCGTACDWQTNHTRTTKKTNAPACVQKCPKAQEETPTLSTKEIYIYDNI